MLEYEKLDDKNFEEILAEAMECLPGLSPEWTNYNIHDPGITFLEMLCWLTENQRYYLKEITEKHELKHLQLLGVTPEPAVPSKLLAVFEPTNETIPIDTEVEINGITFSFIDEVTLSAADVKISHSFDEKMVEVYGFKPFGEMPRIGNCFYLHLSEPILPNIKYRIYFQISSYKDIIRTPMEEGYYPLAVMRAEIFDDGEWFVSKIEDKTYGLTQTGVIFAESPRSGRLIRFTLEFCEIDIPPMLEWISLRTAELVQVKQMKPLILPYKENPLPLETTPQIVMSKELSILSEEDGGVYRWSEVQDLASSDPFDRHYELSAADGLLYFGDNIHGKRPLSDLIIKSIKLTLGSGGNVKENLKFSLFINDTEIKGYNPFPSSGGSNAETVDEAFERFIAERDSPKTLIKKEDTLALVKKTPGLCIKNTTAYSETPGTLTICVNPINGKLNNTYKKNIRKWIFDAKLPCTRLEIVSPDFWEMELYAELSLEKWAGGREREAREFLESYVKELERQFKPVISLSEWKTTFEKDPIIYKVNELFLRRINGEIITANVNYPLPPNGLMKINNMNVITTVKL